MKKEAFLFLIGDITRDIPLAGKGIYIEKRKTFYAYNVGYISNCYLRFRDEETSHWFSSQYKSRLPQNKNKNSEENNLEFE